MFVILSLSRSDFKGSQMLSKSESFYCMRVARILLAQNWVQPLFVERACVRSKKLVANLFWPLLEHDSKTKVRDCHLRNNRDTDIKMIKQLQQ